MTAGGLLRGLRRRLGFGDTREPGSVNHISLGSHCHTAQILKGLGLRRWSAPFDWTFSSPGMVRDCLADDFTALLDPDQYESTPLAERKAPDETRCRHRLYRERHAIPFVFNHHDPATSADDYRFLREGVRRLRAALALPGARNHFYLMTALPTDEETVRTLAHLLRRDGQDNHLTLLQLVTDPETGPAAASVAEAPDFSWVRLTTRSPSLGVRFADAGDDAFVRDLVKGQAANGALL